MRNLILTAMLIIGLSGITDDSQAEVKIIEHIRFPGHFVKDEMEGRLDKSVQVILNTSSSDVDCLARNIYFESNGQGESGMLAVGLVTLNRLESGKFGATICKVVHQKVIIKVGSRWKAICQFSWNCDKRSNKIKNKEAYENCVTLARQVLTGNIPYQTKKVLRPIIKEHATHFHTKYVKPAWSKSYRLVAIVGDHKFYRPKKLKA
jgi:spore germination cell wall hydrolase CwlJ-like protein